MPGIATRFGFKIDGTNGLDSRPDRNRRVADYDVYSNQDNWLCTAGRGTDPRAGRRFNLNKQAAGHDRNGAYRRLWSAA